MAWKKKDIQEFSTISHIQEELKRRTPWKKFGPEIIAKITENSNGDIGLLKRFIYISEKENITKNYIQIVADKSQSAAFHLALFAVTLERWGYSRMDFIDLTSHGTPDHFTLVCTIDMAFTSALLCNKYSLSSYFGLANLYAKVGWPDYLIKTLNAFDKTVEDLHKEKDEDLCHYNRAVKARMSEDIEKMDQMRVFLNKPVPVTIHRGSSVAQGSKVERFSDFFLATLPTLMKILSTWLSSAVLVLGSIYLFVKDHYIWGSVLTLLTIIQFIFFTVARTIGFVEGTRDSHLRLKNETK